MTIITPTHEQQLAAVRLTLPTRSELDIAARNAALEIRKHRRMIKLIRKEYPTAFDKPRPAACTLNPFTGFVGELEELIRQHRQKLRPAEQYPIPGRFQIKFARKIADRVRRALPHTAVVQVQLRGMIAIRKSKRATVTTTLSAQILKDAVRVRTGDDSVVGIAYMLETIHTDEFGTVASCRFIDAKTCKKSSKLFFVRKPVTRERWYLATDQRAARFSNQETFNEDFAKAVGL